MRERRERRRVDDESSCHVKTCWRHQTLGDGPGSGQKESQGEEDKRGAKRRVSESLARKNFSRGLLGFERSLRSVDAREAVRLLGMHVIPSERGCDHNIEGQEARLC